MKLNSQSKRALLISLKQYLADDSADAEAIHQFFAALDTPKSLAGWLLFSSGEHDQLLELDVDPLAYSVGDADKLHLDYLAISFLSKYESLTTTYDKKKRGLQKFLEFEDLCKETNLRFKSDSRLEKTEFALHLFCMRRKIDLILGEFSIDELLDKSSWGPGVSTLLKGSDTSASRKFQSEIGITQDAYALLADIIPSAYPQWFDSSARLAEPVSFEVGNDVISVPKNSKIDRIIAVEPGLNLFFQKGCGSMIRDRLGRRGIDLRDQRRNQELARVGSLTGAVATIDFSSASDSISREVVRHLMPVDWYLVMNDLRSRCGRLDGKTFLWEKFSSMGNGFTFELESLIFYSAALACCQLRNIDPSDVSVYGDDVIIPTEIVGDFSSFCEFLGFRVNKSKSFSSGSFRESCGAHYFDGFDVKPIFHRRKLSNVQSVYKLANSIRRLSHRRNFGYGCDRRFLSCWRSILSGLPVALRGLKIPDGFGDGGILSNFDESCPSLARFGHEGFDVIHLSAIAMSIEHNHRGLLNAKLCDIRGSSSDLRIAIGVETSGGNDVPLRSQTRMSIGHLRVISWYDLGEWI